MAKKNPTQEGFVEARVLVDGAHGKINDVVDVPVESLESLSGVVDADPAAVAYAKSIA